ncbi:MAG TPA: NUDIX hydrolase [Longimicrobiales bacterium]
MAKRGRGRKSGVGRRRGGGRQRARIETSAGGVVFRRSDGGGVMFLLIRDPYENWGLPKGHVEGEETPEQAALREIMEETGLAGLRAECELPTIDWYFRDRGRLVHKFCHFYLVESRMGEARPQREEGITDCVWLPPDEAIRTITYENAREVLRAAIRAVPAGAGGAGD